MAKFLTELDAVCITDKIWCLDEPLIYESDTVGMVEVPKGFYTDFASVPRLPIAYMAFGGRAHREAVLHDYGYRSDATPTMTRKQVDDLFLEAMTERGKGWFTRYAMYWAVRIGAGGNWHRKKVADRL
jgi:hypothetical protein